MVTLIKYGTLSGGEKYNVNVMELDGLSTDTKPNGIYIEYGSDGREIARMTIPNGSVFTEVDTGKTYMYDATGGDWSEVSIGGGGGDKFVAGTNITITDNGDGTKTISASGEVSSEDTVARESIANHKSDKANPHEVTKAQVGLGNVDNTADLDKPLSTAAQTALGAKANSADVYTKAEVDGLLEGIDVPTALSELTDDATHRTVTDTEKATWNAKADVADIPTVPIKGIEKNNTAITPDASGVVNITVPTTAADVSALPDTTLYGSSLSLSINTTTFVVTATLKDQNGNTLGTAQTIDLPLESVVVGGSYNDTTKKVVLTLQNGNTVEFSVADLVAGLQSEITPTNKLDADLVDDSTSANKFVSNTEKSAWNAKASTATATTSTAGLMSSVDKTKLNGIAEGAEANVQSDWNATDTSSDAYIKNKPAIPSASSATPEMNGTASSGSSSYWSRADHVHPTDTSRQAALSASQLAATNSGITNAELVELVDSGAKNLANISFGTVTESGVTAVANADGSITLNGTRTSSSAYIIQASNTPIKIKNNTSYVCKGTNSSDVRVQVIGFSEDETEYHLLTNTSTDIAFDSENWHHYFIRILLTGAATFSDVTIYPMCCLKTAWDISQAYVPYSPSNAELTGEINPTQLTVPTIPTGAHATLESGGYTVTGNIVIVNMRLRFSQATTTSFTICENLPIPLADSSLAANSSIAPVNNNKGLPLALNNAGAIIMPTGATMPAEIVLISCIYVKA